MFGLRTVGYRDVWLVLVATGCVAVEEVVTSIYQGVQTGEVDYRKTQRVHAPQS